VHIYYRLSDASNDKVRPPYVTKDRCLHNFFAAFDAQRDNVTMIADAVTDETMGRLSEFLPPSRIIRTKNRSGSASFSLALDLASQLAPTSPVYLVEDDYLHDMRAPEVLFEGLSLGHGFVTLYDHPDKYMEPEAGGNPQCAGGAENTRVYLTKSCHWKETNSTTMTFASTAEVLRRARRFMNPYLKGRTPQDFRMFLRLRRKGFTVVSSIPGFATHGETRWLSPLRDWDQCSDS
jgi:hypothetical protein